MTGSGGTERENRSESQSRGLESRPNLDVFGWDEGREKEFREFAERGFFPGRVTVGYGIWLRVVTEKGEITAIRPGRMRIRSRPDEWPVVGDWVALRSAMGHVVEADKMHVPEDDEIVNGEDAPPEDASIDPPSAMIEAVLPRRTRLARKAPGAPTTQQVMASNVDYAWLVTALGPDFNPRRFERYLGLAREGGATPIVVLNKADLVGAEEAERCAALVRDETGGRTSRNNEEMREQTPDDDAVPVLIVSCRTGQGIEELRGYLRKGSTIVLLGSSGVGKSTLINELAGCDWYSTREVRNDGRGRHTTTRRELRMLPGGGLIVDTPGIREIQVWEEERAVEVAFPDIEELALGCRFSNCSHGNEPGCAVRAALEAGTLREDRLKGWLKLRAEAEALSAMQDLRGKLERKRRDKMGSKAMKEFKKPG